MLLLKKVVHGWTNSYVFGVRHFLPNHSAHIIVRFIALSNTQLWKFV